MGLIAASSGAEPPMPIPRIPQTTGVAMAHAAFRVHGHFHIEDSLELLTVDLLRVQVVGTARTPADVLTWLASHDAHRDVALMDVFRREGTGFRVSIHKSRQPIT